MYSFKWLRLEIEAWIMMLPFIIALINHTTFCSLELKKPHFFCDVNFNCFLSGRPLQADLHVPQLLEFQKDHCRHTHVYPASLPRFGTGHWGGALGIPGWFEIWGQKLTASTVIHHWPKI
jgi:hypothetical protein